MKKSRYSEEQNIDFLKEASAGIPITVLEGRIQRCHVLQVANQIGRHGKIQCQTAQ